MKKNELQELEQWCKVSGYKKVKKHQLLREDWRWFKTTRDDDGGWQYVTYFLVYDYVQRGSPDLAHPYGVRFYVIAESKNGREYHLSRSIDWGRDNLEDVERLAREFYDFAKEK